MNTRQAVTDGRVARIGLALADWSEKWFPDPLVFAFLGVLVVYALGVAAGESPAKLGLEAVNCAHVAVVETWNAVDVVIGDGRTKYDLHVLGWRKLVFKRGLADGVTSAAPLAKVGLCFRFERFFPFDAGR